VAPRAELPSGKENNEHKISVLFVVSVTIIMNYEAPYYVIFSILLLLPHSYVQIFSALCSQTMPIPWDKRPS
jgi:hypothetical protein